MGHTVGGLTVVTKGLPHDIILQAGTVWNSEPRPNDIRLSESRSNDIRWSDSERVDRVLGLQSTY